MKSDPDIGSIVSVLLGIILAIISLGLFFSAFYLAMSGYMPVPGGPDMLLRCSVWAAIFCALAWAAIMLGLA